MPVEVFISRPVHDALLSEYPGLIEEIFAENPECRWSLAGVRVTISPTIHRSYIQALNGLVISLSSKFKQYEFSGQV